CPRVPGECGSATDAVLLSVTFPALAGRSENLTTYADGAASTGGVAEGGVSAAGGASPAGGVSVAGAAATAPSPFFLPMASIRRASSEPGSLSNRTSWV